MSVVLLYVHKSGEALAEPHGDLSLHVDSEGLKTFLETAHGVELKGAGVLAEVHTSDLGHTQAAHGDETWRKFTRERRKSLVSLRQSMKT